MIQKKMMQLSKKKLQVATAYLKLYSKSLMQIKTKYQTLVTDTEIIIYVYDYMKQQDAQ